MAKATRHAVFYRGAVPKNFGMFRGPKPNGSVEQKPDKNETRTKKLYADLVKHAPGWTVNLAKQKSMELARRRNFASELDKAGTLHLWLRGCPYRVEVDVKNEKAYIRLKGVKQGKAISKTRVKLRASAGVNNARGATQKDATRNNSWYMGSNGIYGTSKNLLEADPKAAREWNAELNGGIPPRRIAANLKLERWWTCSVCGGDYLMPVNERVAGGKCPYCSYKEVLSGYNDLATKAPVLADELVSDYADQLLFGSNKPKVWECSNCGCVWRETPFNRVNSLAENRRVCDCPACGKDATDVDDDTLFDVSAATMAPELLEIYDPDDNDGLELDEIGFMTDEELIWVCPEGHTWYETPQDAILNDCLCPVCAGEAEWDEDEDSEDFLDEEDKGDRA